jgi:hypothetical protein
MGSARAELVELEGIAIGFLLSLSQMETWS